MTVPAFYGHAEPGGSFEVREAPRPTMARPSTGSGGSGDRFDGNGEGNPDYLGDPRYLIDPDTRDDALEYFRVTRNDAGKRIHERSIEFGKTLGRPGEDWRSASARLIDAQLYAASLNALIFSTIRKALCGLEDIADGRVS
ncbi:MAG: hypothetical protein AAF389_15005 [Gemmatimonadota bacterium]